MKFSKTRTLLCTLGAVFLCSAFAAVPARAETAFDPHSEIPGCGQCDRI